MSREIKFRAWDNHTNSIEEISDLYWFEENFVHKNGDSYYILMQYTGLKDKNGTPIYEGDIVEGGFGIPLVKVISLVVFEEGMFLIHTPKHDPQICSVFDAIEFLEIEVIGNIYENPELLKGENACK